MRLPILYPENRPLAARSLQDSARALNQLGRTEQAETLLREVSNQYKDFADGM
jgi:C4-dicarboxylate-specific signal transduction histidine kinase